jgi:hypothetical protein
MTRAKKILIGVGVIALAIGGYALTKFLTRNVVRDRGWTVEFIEYDTPPIEEPLED